MPEIYTEKRFSGGSPSLVRDIEMVANADAAEIPEFAEDRQLR